jgi:hypothetical protein
MHEEDRRTIAYPFPLEGHMWGRLELPPLTADEAERLTAFIWTLVVDVDSHSRGIKRRRKPDNDDGRP